MSEVRPNASSIDERFEHPHAILPVVNLTPEPKAHRIARESILLAIDEGADGVFLIDRLAEPSDWRRVFNIQDALKDDRDLKDTWIGVNNIYLSAMHNMAHIRQWAWPIDGLWVYDAGIHKYPDGSFDNYPEVVGVYRNEQDLKYFTYFGGIAHKGSDWIEDSEEAAELAVEAAKFMDVVTTGGAKVGWATSLRKIQRIKQSIGEKPLAIASGISSENITDYVDYADAFLVTNGIEYDFGRFDKEALRGLVRVVREREQG